MAGFLTIDRALAVERGGEAVCACRIRNTGSVVDQFSVQVMGPAAAWTIADPPSLSLFPGTEGVVNLRMRPPDSFTAGSVPFGVKLQSATDPSSTVVEEGALAVGAFVSVAARLAPRVSKGRGGGKHKLILRNTGNTPARVRVAGSDPDDVIRFRGLGGAPVTLAPGARQDLPIRYRSTASHMTGPAENHEFTISVVPEGGEPVPVKGALLQKAAISGWIPRLAIAAIAVIALVLILKAVSKSGQPQSTARTAGTAGVAAATVPPSPIPAPATPTPTPAAGTPTPANGGGGGQPTKTPVPPTKTPTPPPVAAPPTPFALASVPLAYDHFAFFSSSVHVISAGVDQTVATGYDPVWSPNGTQLAYFDTATSAGNPIRIGTPSGTTMTAVTTPVASCSGCQGLAWSPDGSRLSYIDGSGSLNLVNTNGTSARTLVPSAVPVTSGSVATGVTAWAPNGTWVVYGNPTGVFAIKPDGTGNRQLNNAPRVNAVSFKPDGTAFIYTSGPDADHMSISVMPTDGNVTVGPVTQLVIPSSITGGLWDRSGRYVYFSQLVPGKSFDIFRFDTVAGGTRTQVTASSAASSGGSCSGSMCLFLPAQSNNNPNA